MPRRKSTPRKKGDSSGPLTLKLKYRDVTFMKPTGHEDWLTISELSVKTKKDISWLRRLERAKRIPKAKRFKHGQLQIRLWSPLQANEIERIMKTLKPGRPKRNA
jgi:hypothetical protein